MKKGKIRRKVRDNEIEMEMKCKLKWGINEVEIHAKWKFGWNLRRPVDCGVVFGGCGGEIWKWRGVLDCDCFVKWRFAFDESRPLNVFLFFFCGSWRIQIRSSRMQFYRRGTDWAGKSQGEGDRFLSLFFFNFFGSKVTRLRGDRFLGFHLYFGPSIY